MDAVVGFFFAGFFGGGDEFFYDFFDDGADHGFAGFTGFGLGEDAAADFAAGAAAWVFGG